MHIYYYYLGQNVEHISILYIWPDKVNIPLQMIDNNELVYIVYHFILLKEIFRKYIVVLYYPQFHFLRFQLPIVNHGQKILNEKNPGINNSLYLNSMLFWGVRWNLMPFCSTPPETWIIPFSSTSHPLVT